MSAMRAKMVVQNIVSYPAEGEPSSQVLSFGAVCKSDGYPADGSDEDNTYSKWTPTASVNIHITNPALFDKFKVGEKYYVDFSKAD